MAQEQQGDLPIIVEAMDEEDTDEEDTDEEERGVNQWGEDPNCDYSNRESIR